MSLFYLLLGPCSMEHLLPILKAIHATIRDNLIEVCESQPIEILSEFDRDNDEDTAYRIDKYSEDQLVSVFDQHWGLNESAIIIAEGFKDEGFAYPKGSDRNQANWRIIIDPIDGTRGLMYQKRSAWILTGIAPNKGDSTSLRDIELAIQTEIPTTKQHLSDVIWGIQGQGTQGERWNRITKETEPLPLKPTQNPRLEHGFATFCRYCPGGRDVLSSVDEGLLGDEDVIDQPAPGKVFSFEDQYISSGGHMYELMMGHDRFVADLRPLLANLPEGKQLFAATCHPYDICTEMLARQVGIEVTNEEGEALDVPLDLNTKVTWIAYANKELRKRVEPKLRALLKLHNLLPKKS